jgi:multidrug resistance efflux pump
MIRKYGLPLAGIALLGFAVLHVIGAQLSPPPAAPPVEPARTPFSRTVAGTGIVEAQTENIAVGSGLAGVVAEVLVRPGRKVPAGEPLFRLDERALRAELKVREANLAAARAQLARLKEPPRGEEVPIREARVREARAALRRQQDQLERARALAPRRAIAHEELIRLEQACEEAREQLARARAEDRLFKAGTWGPDLAVARTQVAQARAQVAQTRTELDRLLVRAPVAGVVLQVNVRPGETVGTQPGPGLVVLGSIGRLHVRVQIDEQDIPRFRAGAQASATLRGHRQVRLPLTFVRVEPYVVPKKSLTNEGAERVDTRVLRVIFAVDIGPAPLYVGQMVDVFIDAGDRSPAPPAQGAFSRQA